MKKLAVSFAIDENYLKPFLVCATSLMENRNENYFYDIFLLVPGDFTKESINKILKFEKCYENFKVNIINLEDAFSDVKMNIPHISYITYFRFELAKYLKGYDKCLYMDVDIIINKDISELFDIDLGDKLLGAVAHPSYSKRVKNKITRRRMRLGSYFNAGVLLFNLGQIRKEEKDKEWIALIERAFNTQDQDILNYSCYKRVKYIDIKYNYMSKILRSNFMVKLLAIKLYGFKVFSRVPSIIHYADKIKPWNDNGMPFWKEWDYYEKIYKKNS